MTKDTIVCVRVPSSLVKELRELAEKNHYMDLSEELRSIIRDKCNEHLSGRTTPAKTTDTHSAATQKIIDQQKTLVNGLQNIIKELQKNEK